LGVDRRVIGEKVKTRIMVRLLPLFLQIYSVFDEEFFGIIAMATAPSNGIELASTMSNSPVGAHF
jgi:hypothetical protein